MTADGVRQAATVRSSPLTSATPTTTPAPPKAQMKSRQIATTIQRAALWRAFGGAGGGPPGQPGG